MVYSYFAIWKNRFASRKYQSIIPGSDRKRRKIPILGIQNPNVTTLVAMPTQAVALLYMELRSIKSALISKDKVPRNVFMNQFVPLKSVSNVPPAIRYSFFAAAVVAEAYKLLRVYNSESGREGMSNTTPINPIAKAINAYDSFTDLSEMYNARKSAMLNRLPRKRKRSSEIIPPSGLLCKSKKMSSVDWVPGA